MAYAIGRGSGFIHRQRRRRYKLLEDAAASFIAVGGSIMRHRRQRLWLSLEVASLYLNLPWCLTMAGGVANANR